MKNITVFTPTFNRSKTLPILYKSLINQNNKDFIWLIIDDGSTDNTKTLIETWKNEKIIEIQYIYQENGGMLSAHNKAHLNLVTDLAICIDSDDALAKDAIKIINENWSKFKNDDSIAGFVGLDSFTNGVVIGGKFQQNHLRINFKEVKKIKGDKKYVYKTSLLKDYGPYPTIEGEKFPAQDYVYRKIDMKHHLVTINKVLCIVDYQSDGNTANKKKSYVENPNGFMKYRVLMMGSNNYLDIKLRNAIHYVSCCFLIKKPSKIFINRYFYFTIPAIIPGFLLYYNLIKYKK